MGKLRGTKKFTGSAAAAVTQADSDLHILIHTREFLRIGETEDLARVVWRVLLLPALTF